ncbi:superoxide dismutase [candidate division KSB1 bacterium]|nr:superoxide dismutase [candidate division KSB1 bacterium]
MKILAIERDVEGKTSADCAPFLKEEAQAVWRLYSKGIFREIYFRADRKSAVLVLECENVAAAHEILSLLPLVRKELISFEVIPLAPYPGFERLFSQWILFV